MENEKKEWETIEIRYTDRTATMIRKEDLDKIDAIDDVINALQQAKTLVASLQGILGE